MKPVYYQPLILEKHGKPDTEQDKKFAYMMRSRLMCVFSFRTVSKMQSGLCSAQETKGPLKKVESRDEEQGSQHSIDPFPQMEKRNRNIQMLVHRAQSTRRFGASGTCPSCVEHFGSEIVGFVCEGMIVFPAFHFSNKVEGVLFAGNGLSWISTTASSICRQISNEHRR